MIGPFVRGLLRLLTGRRLPRTNGTIRVAGPRAVITISRDQWGIPHINAGNDFDAWFGLGFCQAQDRAFQLELTQRIARGSLAAWLGARAIPIDRLSRRVGFHRSAVAQWRVLDADIQQVATAFTAGINSGYTDGIAAKPHEFVILGGRPTPWTPEDVFAFVKLQSFILPSNWDAELARLQVIMHDGPESLRALDPSVAHLMDEVEAIHALIPPVGGSNNWAIHGSRTASGRPLVCNDPHLNPSLPSQWYLAHITTPEWSLAGAAFAGSPGFAAGFNGHVAWGATAGLTDNADVFLEKLSPDGNRVRQGDEWIDCIIHREMIEVKGQSAIVEEVHETPRGPIIAQALSGQWPALSLRATWLDAKPLRGFQTIMRAKTGDEFRREFADWPCLPLNLVYADTHGDIGYQLVGHVPRRSQGPGAVPRPGWDSRFAWGEIIPFDEMPHVVNPPEGFFATANNAPPGHDRNSPLGFEWMDPYRVDAIREALAEHRDWSTAKCQRLQMDVRSMPWREIREIVLDAANTRASLRDTAMLLQQWDGNLDPNSKAAAVFELFAATLIVQLAQCQAIKSSEWFLGRIAWAPGVNLFYLKRMAPLVASLREQPKGWFAKSWTDVIADALVHARTTCRDRTWGELHPVRPKSLVLGDHWLFKRAFSVGPKPVGGDADTINQASIRPLKPIGETDNIPGLRMVVDVGNWSASRFVLAGGQSGNPCSSHFGDLFELWLRGDGVTMAWTSEEVRAAAPESLILEPT